MLKNIVFDMGNVILDFDPRKMSSFFTNDEKAIDILCAELFSNKEWLALDKGVTDEETALKGIAALRAFYKSIGMPTTLEELGVPDDQLELLASKVKRAPDGTTGQYVKLTEADCLKIYELMK